MPAPHVVSTPTIATRRNFIVILPGFCLIPFHLCWRVFAYFPLLEIGLNLNTCNLSPPLPFIQ